MGDDKKTNGASLEAIYQLQLAAAVELGQTKASVYSLIKTSDSMRSDISTLRTSSDKHTLELAQLKELCKSRGERCHARMTQASEERMALQREQHELCTELSKQRDNTGRIRMAVAVKDGETRGRNKLLKAAAAVLGALLAGGGGTLLVQWLSR
jgi:predicted acetyltransferase